MLWTSRTLRAKLISEMNAYGREVAGRLQALRGTRDWSQEDAAHAVGVSVSTWQRWEAGTTWPNPSNWRKITAAFQTGANEIRGESPALDGDLAGQLDRIEERLAVMDSRLGTLERLLGGSPLEEQLTQIFERALGRRAAEAGPPRSAADAGPPASSASPPPAA